MKKALLVSATILLMVAYFIYKPESWPTVPAIERLVYSHQSACFRCGRPWRFVTRHSTFYEPDFGCFPLCERCWKKLETPQARLPYYRKMLEWWIEFTPSDSYKYEIRWQKIKQAVMDGK